MEIKLVIFVIIVPYVLCYQETNQNELYENYNYIKLLLNEFKIQHPNIVTSPKNINSKFLRKYFKNFQMTKVNKFTNMTQISYNYSALIFVHNELVEEKIMNMLKKLNSALVIIKNEKQFNEMANKVALKIDQKIYFILWSTKKTFETYQINNFNVKKQIGYIDQTNNTFNWINGAEKNNFIERRSDFHGVILRGMVEFRGSYLKADPEYLQKSPFYTNNETYLVNGYMSGIMFDILEILQNRLNFSTLLYKRKKESWGFIYPQSNGTFTGTGMVGDIFFQRADLIVAPLGTNHLLLSWQIPMKTFIL